MNRLTIFLKSGTDIAFDKVSDIYQQGGGLHFTYYDDEWGTKCKGSFDLEKVEGVVHNEGIEIREVD